MEHNGKPWKIEGFPLRTVYLVKEEALRFRDLARRVHVVLVGDLGQQVLRAFQAILSQLLVRFG